MELNTTDEWPSCIKMTTISAVILTVLMHPSIVELLFFCQPLGSISYSFASCVRHLGNESFMFRPSAQDKIKFRLFSLDSPAVQHYNEGSTAPPCGDVRTPALSKLVGPRLPVYYLLFLIFLRLQVNGARLYFRRSHRTSLTLCFCLSQARVSIGSSRSLLFRTEGKST